MRSSPSTPAGRELLAARAHAARTPILARRLRDLDADERATLDRAAAILERVLEEAPLDRRAAPRRHLPGRPQLPPLLRRPGRLVSGNWMQTVAEMWLIVQLTGSGVAVGLTAGLQFVPILLFGAWGGLLADRLPKRRAAHGHPGAHGAARARALRAHRRGLGRRR